MTAAIWRNDVGLELRVENNGECYRVAVIASRRALDADRRSIKANLIEKGWTEPPNAT